uniref:Uncharacterized protein n=1 Tax=Dromaius novaehollandiae TaxID=8790 RepID=A0A8C4JW95_DRONO
MTSPGAGLSLVFDLSVVFRTRRKRFVEKGWGIPLAVSPVHWLLGHLTIVGLELAFYMEKLPFGGGIHSAKSLTEAKQPNSATGKCKPSTLSCLSQDDGLNIIILSGDLMVSFSWKCYAAGDIPHFCIEVVKLPLSLGLLLRKARNGRGYMATLFF